MKMICGMAILLYATLHFSAPVEAQDTVQPQGASASAANKALYDLNYDVDPRSDAITERTTAAIAQWRRNRGAPSTGMLTVEELDRLQHVDKSNWIWGSIAGTLDGESWAAWNAHSRAEAEAEVSAKCARITHNPKACTIGSTFSRQEGLEGWVVYALCSRHVAAQRRTLYSLTVDGGGDRNATIEGAMDYLISKGYSRGQCSVKSLIEVRHGPQK